VPAKAVAARPVVWTAPPPSPITDLPASFSGKFPCANCTAIRHELNLFADNTYSLTRFFENNGRAERVENEGGAWGFSSDRRVLVLKSTRGTWSWFAIPATGVLRAVDTYGESIGLREPWDLQRNESFRATLPPPPQDPSVAPRTVTVGFSDVEWKLTELHGKPLRPVTKGKQDILLMLDADTGTFSGQSACNPVEGTFDAGVNTMNITPHRPLRLCRIDDGTERALSNMFKAIRTYRITGPTLDLFDELGSRIARFEGHSISR